MALMSQIVKIIRFSNVEQKFIKNSVCSFLTQHSRFTMVKQPVLVSKMFHKYYDEKCCHRYFSSESANKENLGKKPEDAKENAGNEKLSQRARLKQAVRDYGATIVVFHVAISLTSLGLCYVAISNGVDVMSLLAYVGFSESITSSKLAQGGSTFAISYAVHKLFAPVRIGITLTAAPFIVRYLRQIKLLKPPKVS